VSSQYYQSGDERAAQVRRLFAAIARRYDRLNDVLSLGLHRRWKRRLVAASVADARPASRRDGGHDKPRVLDLCCGTGDLAGRFAGRVVGADFSAEMLQVAQTRRRGNIRWVQADALRLPFADGSFDVVSVGYGLRNLADLAAGLREIRRVLRPGGQLLSLDFGKPASALWRRLYFAHLQFWVPVLGWLLAGNRAAYAYILPSLENYPGQRGVQAAMEQAGFVGCGFEEFCGGAMALNYGRKSASAT
jgi:demethylmenaquinone methyltransferase / 2-methoxy-6-polyprenyl-1,4-benzoquinol methylase